MRSRITTKCVFPGLLILLVGSAPVAVADFIAMVDVDKPTGVPTTYNKWGDFTNIDNNWTDTCWQAVSASMLNYVGFGSTGVIYDWFHSEYGNVGATNSVWRDRINYFISKSPFGAPPGLPYVGRLTVNPTDDWAEAMIGTSPIGLGVICGGDYTGGHAITYSGFHDVHDWSWIADPDADFRSETLPEPPAYMDWSLFDDVASSSTNWMLERTWTDGQHLTFDVDGAVYLERVPEPASLTLGLIGLGYTTWRLRRRKTLR